ncbi:hypothetical protein ACA910_019002 [Epithemia clementina (nom. ined.)]
MTTTPTVTLTTTDDDDDDLPFPRFYPIGTPGQPWTQKEDDEWKKTVPKFQRSYQEQVLDPLQAFAEHANDWAVVEQYGTLSYHDFGKDDNDHDNDDAVLLQYPLMAVRNKHWHSQQQQQQQQCVNVLITGGVHGYETSGVQGALLFLQTKAEQYTTTHNNNNNNNNLLNWVVIPCVSPWSYEHVQRWQAQMMDPNRSFFPNDPAHQTPESRALMEYLFQTLPQQQQQPQKVVVVKPDDDSKADQKNSHDEDNNDTNTNKPTIAWTCHLDLHETTDSDETEFRPAKFARAGLPYRRNRIPDGFYLVGNSGAVVARRRDDNNENENNQTAKEQQQQQQQQFQQQTMQFLEAILTQVETVTHIAPTDEHGNLALAMRAVARGICAVPMAYLGLCGGVTGAPLVATTEVYPDSTGTTTTVTPEICNQAQVAAVTGALDYILLLLVSTTRMAGNNQADEF